MAKAIARQGGFRRGTAASRLVAFVAMFAFLLQSYITQTHIHGSTPGTAIGSVHVTDHGKAPAGNSPVDCPFCQAITDAGAFVGTAPPVLSVPFAWMTAQVVLVSTTIASLAIAHDWKSRAPPLH